MSTYEDEYKARRLAEIDAEAQAELMAEQEREALLATDVEGQRALRALESDLATFAPPNGYEGAFRTLTPPTDAEVENPYAADLARLRGKEWKP